MYMEKEKKIKILSILAFVGVLSIMLGVSVAFFNYTRTGTANIVRTGRIVFNSSQDGRINLTNLFPINTEEPGIMDDSTKVGTITINVSGDTTYNQGVEYLISATNITNIIGTGDNKKKIPISVMTTASGTLGTSNDDYFEERYTTDNHIYSLLTKDVINENDKIMVGYIAPGAEGINGNITIKAYLDRDKIAISDTYNSIGITDEMGTTKEWANGRTVFTTQEWNEFQNTSITFQIKVEANEGIWVSGVSTSIDCFTYQEKDDGIEITHYDNSCGTDVIIPKTINNLPVKKISGFYNSNIKSVVIPDSVTEIGNNAFLYNNLNSIVIPNSVTTIGNHAFDNNQLTSVVISDSVTIIEDGAFSENQLTSIVIPDSVTTIGLNAFTGNMLNTITLGKNVRQIGKYAFGYYRAIGLYEGIISLSSIENNSNSLFDWDYIFLGETDQRDIFVFGEYSLGNVTVSITGNNSSADCFTFSEFTLIDYDDKKTSCGTDVIIPNNVTTIKSNALSEKNLTSVVIPDSVTTIESDAFSNNKLTEVVIPDSVTTIGSDAFRNNKLTEVVIPDSVTEIGVQAFVCNDLHQVTIGRNVTTIDSMAFFLDAKYNSNISLSKIINKSNRAFDWKNILEVGEGTPFVTGTYTYGTGTVEITSQ